jgi:hypothetical protein
MAVRSGGAEGKMYYRELLEDPGQLSVKFKRSHSYGGQVARLLLAQPPFSQLHTQASTAKKYRYTLEVLVYNLYQCWLGQAEQAKPVWFSVSLDRDHWANDYVYKDLSYNVFKKLIEAAKDGSLIEISLGKWSPDPSKRTRTLIRPLPDCAKIFAEMEHLDPISIESGRSLIRLLEVPPDPPSIPSQIPPLDEKPTPILKKPAPKRWKGEIMRETEILTKINESNQKFKWAVDGVHSRFLDVAYRKINLEENGGRIYCEAQNLRREDRARLTIDGQPTIEVDLSANHPSICYAMAGLVPPDRLYEVGDLDRDLVKSALVRILNCSSRQEAVCSIAAQWLPPDSKLKFLPADLAGRAQSLIFDIQQAHQPIAKFFFTGIGLKLMGIEGEIALEVCERFADLAKPILNIHDGFRVLAGDKDLLVSELGRTIRERFNYEPQLKIV